MESPVIAQASRMHPLMVVAAVSVTLVSLIGVAAITGIIPSSHGTSVPTSASAALIDQANTTAAPVRYVTADGRVLEEVPGARVAAPLQRVRNVENVPVYEAEPVARQAPVRPRTVSRPVVRHTPARHIERHYVNNTYAEPAPTYERRVQQQPAYAPPAHPVVNYISDMHPVGTGVGAVLGGVLGNQIGGGNGKKLATVAGVLLGGYAGNEVAHNRSPLPGQ